MHVAVASYKGGVGKTTTAVHIAAYLQQQGPTLLLDGDPTHNATEWEQRGPGFPFRIADVRSAMKLAGEYKHSVIDTGQRPSNEDLKHLAEGCDLLIIPAVPLALDTDGLVLTVKALQSMKISHYRVLITKAPPAPETEAQQLRAMLEELKIPLFKTNIPRLKAFSKASATGVLASQVEDSRANRAWEAYEAIGKEMMSYAITR
jgi:chromosome partitioning protein